MSHSQSIARSAGAPADCVALSVRGRPTSHWRINPALFENAFTEITENRLVR